MTMRLEIAKICSRFSATLAETAQQAPGVHPFLVLALSLPVRISAGVCWILFPYR
jgi:hypothetical protein